MFYPNLELALAVTRERRSDRLKQAEISRLLKKIRADRPSLRSRLLLKAGDFLIFCGLRLKKRYQTVSQPTDVPIPQAG